MKIQSTNPAFKSGLTHKILKAERGLDTKAVQNYLLQNKGILSDFKSNKPTTLAVLLGTTILDSFKTKYNGFNLFCPSIRTYEQKELITNKNLHNFCIQEKQFVLKNHSPFEKGSIFYEKVNSLEEMNSIIETDSRKGKRSSGHFLAETIHEMLHAIYLEYISKINPKLLPELQEKTFNEKENTIIKNTLGSYASESKNQYHEVFAETFTQVICNSLDNCILVKNPKEELRKYPQNFLNIIKKVLHPNIN